VVCDLWVNCFITSTKTEILFFPDLCSKNLCPESRTGAGGAPGDIS